jgi:hypothetical protein
MATIPITKRGAEKLKDELHRLKTVERPSVIQARACLGFVIGGMLLALLVQYGVSPRIVARDNLKLWHSVGTVMYALQWACSLLVLWRIARPVPSGGGSP